VSAALAAALAVVFGFLGIAKLAAVPAMRAAATHLGSRWASTASSEASRWPVL
jgi:hypothetical protein